MATLTSKVVSGRMLSGMRQVYVEVWVNNTIRDYLLGAAFTSDQGSYAITYDEPSIAPAATAVLQVYVKIYQDDQLIKSTIGKPIPVLRGVLPQTVIGSADDDSGETMFVKGLISTPRGRGIPNIIVRAFNKATGPEIFLSEGITTAGGNYSIYYNQRDKRLSVDDDNIDLLVKVYKTRADKEPVMTSPLIVNALPGEIINLSVGEGDYRGLDLYTSILETLSGSIQQAGINEILEREVYILSNRYDLDLDNVSSYVHAIQLATQWTALPAELYFGWLKTGLPDNLPELFNMPADQLAESIDKAIEINYIPETAAKYKTGLERLAAQWRTDHIITAKGDRLENGSVGDLLAVSTLTPAMRKQLMDDWQQFEGGVDEFWTRQQKNVGDENYKDLELTLQLGSVTRNHIPLIQTLKSKKRLSRIQDIAAITEEDWLKLIEENKLEVPDDTPGDTPALKRKEYAAQLRNTATELVPTAALAHAFKTDADLVATVFNRFMDRNPAFEFRGATVSAYLKANPDALKDETDKAAAQKELEAVQRIFHLTPVKNKATGAKILWQNKLHSAYAIKMSGFSTLQNMLGDEDLAQQIYSKASGRHSRAQLYKMQAASMMTPVYAITPGIAGLFKNLSTDADLEALFGDQGFCSCKHCDSFFSPSAYLTDLFLNLGKIKVAGSSRTDQDTALEKLFKRRPDLGNIQLDCDNSNTPLPYIDLVNEVMEMAISPLLYQAKQVNIFGKQYTLPLGKVPQTATTAPVLKAFPQHIRQQAYQHLIKGDNNQVIGFPWILPFNLSMLETRTYLDHLGVARSSLLASIAGGNASAQAIALEYLDLLPEELSIFSEQDANAQTTTRFWGSSAGELKKVPVFLQQTGYSYEKLALLLSMRCIQPAQAIVFSPANSCLAADASMPGLSDEVLSRMHRFGRLLLKTNDTMHALDRSVMAFGGDINPGFLEQYAGVLRTERLLAAKDRKEMLSWWIPLEHEDYTDDMSLYTKLFRTPETIPAFRLNNAGTELLTPGVVIDPLAAPLDPDLLAPILSATRLSSGDLELLVSQRLPGSVITLTLAQISYLYAVASFCRHMKLTISHYIAFANLLGFEPVSNIAKKAAPADTLSFTEGCRIIQQAGFNPEDLQYILLHAYESKLAAVLSETGAATRLQQLHATITAQLQEAFPAGTTAKDKIALKLATITGTNDQTAVEKLAAIQNIIAGTSMLGVPEQQVIIESQMPFFSNVQDAKDKLTGAAQLAGDARFNYTLAAIERFLLVNTIVQHLSETMALPPILMLPLLQRQLLHPSNAAAKAMEVFLGDTFINLDPVQPWTTVTHPDAFAAIIRIHKIILLINTLGLTVTDIAFLMEQGSNIAGIPDFNTLPVQPKQAVDGMDGWKNLFLLAALNKKTFKEAGSAFSILASVQDNSISKDQLLAMLAAMSGWKPEDTGFLTGPDGMNLNYPGGFSNGVWLVKTGEALELIDRTGATARQAAGWTVAVITKTQADSVRHAAMAKYGEAQWQEITVPLRHNIREAQRDALVQYVLHYCSKHTGQQFTDTDDMYGYYLIDTQMAACTDTSRIVLAASSVQLFVQRIMMNLELGMSLTSVFAKEWKWRKYYRVWEANRKVFMWPENWIEPELRDDKTPIFKELENNLMQGELSTENIENAYVNYLEKLHDVSHLKIAGMYDDEDSFHVIAQTSGKTPSYFYRRWENKFQWTPWEKIELDIFNGEEVESKERGILLVPYVHNRRLFLFWPQFKLKNEKPTDEEDHAIEALKTAIDQLDSDIRKKQRTIDRKMGIINSLEDKKNQIKDVDSEWKFIDLGPLVEAIQEKIDNIKEQINGEDGKSGHEGWIRNKKSDKRKKEEQIRVLEQGHSRYIISMAWSQYRNGCWTPKKVSQREIKTPLFMDDTHFGPSLNKYVVIPTTTNAGNINFAIRYTDSEKAWALTSYFTYDDCKSEITVANYKLVVKSIDLPHPMSFMKLSVNNEDTPVVYNILNKSNKTIPLLVKSYKGSREIKSFQSGIDKTANPFFYEDPLYSFFVSPPLGNFSLTKGISFAKSSALRSGTSTLRGNADRLLADASNSIALGSGDGDDNSESFAVNETNPVMFYQAAHASQVIVRAKDSRQRAMGSTGAFKMAKTRKVFKIADNGIKAKMFLDMNGYRFHPFYHPYTCLFLKQINRYGVDGLLSPDSFSADGKELLYQQTPSQMTSADFKLRYQPNMAEVNWLDTKEEIDFTNGHAYATYNWELFFHIPLFIATRLSQDQRFDEAQKWFHYIFDPTEAEGEVPYRFWKIKPFHTYTVAAIKQDMDAILKGGEGIKKQVKAWEDNPFNPHMLARFRRLAYMKTVVMKYLDNLIAWGDQLFRMDSIESMNEATQLYVLAAQILGKMPVETEAKPRDSKSFNELAESLTIMGNAWVDLENSMDNEDESDDGFHFVAKKNLAAHLVKNNTWKMKDTGNKLTGQGATTSILDDILYFCMSPNEKLLSYWDTVADRLFKIRNCMNIEGRIRSVPLFQPPIDPALLVRAAAAGMDISSAISDLYAPMPFYRFQVLIQKSQELCQELKALGSSLLSVLEKKDAEQLSLIKSQHEIQLLQANKDIKQQQIEEARLAVRSLEESQKLAQLRLDNYSDRDFINPAEVAAMVLSTGATVMQAISAGVSAAGAVSAQAPDLTVAAHAQSLASGTSASTVLPGAGTKNSETAKNSAHVFDILAMIGRDLASNVSSLANYERRMEDWDLQIDMAAQEIKQLDKQILGAMVRQEIAARDKENLELQIDNSRTADAYMRTKYTNQELYGWMTGQVSAVYFQTYKMAYDIARQAERAFRFELGTESSNFIQFGYWDNMRKGLLSGERLFQDLKRLDLAYLEKNKRDYEIIKHVSLARLDPLSLIRLRATGLCEFQIPEVIFDMDHPGHYFRRIKSVSISMPCIAGPYTSVSATLSLQSHQYRKNSSNTGSYAADPEGNDERFVFNTGATQSIATSNAQNDSGLFELNFRDERYLPFEGLGAIGNWRLELPSAVKQFDYNTITDVILHIKYTARDGGAPLRTAAEASLIEQLNTIKQTLTQGTIAEGMHTAINMKHDMPNEWHLLKQTGLVRVLIDKSRLPYMIQPLAASIDSVMVLAAAPESISITVNNNAVNLASLDALQLYKGMTSEIQLGTAFTLGATAEDKDKLQDLLLVVKYVC